MHLSKFILLNKKLSQLYFHGNPIIQKRINYALFSMAHRNLLEFGKQYINTFVLLLLHVLFYFTFIDLSVIIFQDYSFTLLIGKQYLNLSNEKFSFQRLNLYSAQPRTQPRILSVGVLVILFLVNLQVNLHINSHPYPELNHLFMLLLVQ